MNSSINSLSLIGRLVLALFVFFFLLGSIAQTYFSQSLLPYLGLSWTGISSGHFWTLLTYPFYQSHLISLLFNSLIFYTTLIQLEESWGERVTHSYLAITAILGGLAFVVLSGLFSLSGWCFGPEGLIFSMLVHVARLAPNREYHFMMLFPLKAWQFCALLGALELYHLLFSSAAQPLAHLVTALLGLGVGALLTGTWRRKSSGINPSYGGHLKNSFLPIERLFGANSSSKRPSDARRRTNLKLVKGESDPGPSSNDREDKGGGTWH